MKESTAAIVVTLVLVLLSSAGLAKAQCKKRPIQELAKAVAERFPARTLAGLDKDRAVRGRIKIIIEHSLADDDDPQRFEVRRFSSLAQVEKWLTTREIDGLPGRQSRDFLNCARGVCRINMDGGINHNNLYLKRITYGVSNGCPYLKTIYILDGD